MPVLKNPKIKTNEYFLQYQATKSLSIDNTA